MIKLVGTLRWTFGDGGPYVQTEYPEKADPTPCYSHDMSRVTDLVTQLEGIFPLNPPTNWYVLEFETDSRTNAHASSRGWKDEPYQTYVVILGKRTPIPSAMTRYVVPHEYGHAIHFYCANMASLKAKEAGDDYKEDTIYKAYRNLRGLEDAAAEYYGPKMWHKTVGEIFANDFRILNGYETEFWPHDELRPEKIRGLEEFFQDLKDTYSYKGEESAVLAETTSSEMTVC